MSAGGIQNVREETITVGTTAVQLLKENRKRVAYRIYSRGHNGDIISIGYNNRVSTAAVTKSIMPDGYIEDSGPLKVVYTGEIWAVAVLASQTVTVEEVYLK